MRVRSLVGRRLGRASTVVLATVIGTIAVGIASVRADPAPTSTTLAASTTTPLYATSVTFVATVTAPTPPTGLVTFSDGTTVIGTATPDATGAATLSTAALSVGTHSVVASFAGDANDAASASPPLAVTVSQKTRTDVLFYSQPRGIKLTLWTPLTPVLMVANVIKASPVGTKASPTGTVTFLVDGARFVQPVQNLHYATLSFPNGLSLGKHTVTAHYNGDATFVPSTSGTKSVKIYRNLTTSITDDPDPVTAGQTVRYTVTVTNHGLASAASVEVSDTIPVDASFVAASSSGGCTGTTTVTCLLANLAVGASASATIDVVAPGAAETMTDTATALLGLNPTTTETTTVSAP